MTKLIVPDEIIEKADDLFYKAIQEDFPEDDFISLNLDWELNLYSHSEEKFGTSVNCCFATIYPVVLGTIDTSRSYRLH